MVHSRLSPSFEFLASCGTDGACPYALIPNHPNALLGRCLVCTRPVSPSVDSPYGESCSEGVRPKTSSCRPDEMTLVTLRS